MALGRFFAGMVGLLTLGTGLWFIGVPLIIYSVLPLFRSGRAGATKRSFPLRTILGGLMIGAAGLATVSGGTYSPLVLLFLGLVVLFVKEWPSPLSLGRWESVQGSVLLRWNPIPIFWAVLAEARPGDAQAPQALSSFTGTLMARPKEGTILTFKTYFALGRLHAEDRAVHELRRMASAMPWPVLVPLDSYEAVMALPIGPREVRPRPRSLTSGAASASLLVLESKNGAIEKFGAYVENHGTGGRGFPNAGVLNLEKTLVWELLSSYPAFADRPGDSLSSLVVSLNATRGIPLGQRLQELKSEGDSVKLTTALGQELTMSSPKFRAMVSVYSN